MKKIKIAIGSDHAGLILKNQIKEYLKKEEYDLTDYGTYISDSADYPIYAFKVGEAIRDNNADFGIVCCYSGLGVCIAVNKVRGVRGVTVRTSKEAEMARRHNDANVLCFGQGFTNVDNIPNILHTFFKTQFDGNLPDGERHKRRVSQIENYEG